jgi:tubulin polyglutamylase TTLL6/13
MIDRKKCLEEDRKRVQLRLTGVKTESREEKLENMRKTTNEWLKHVEVHEKKKVGGYKRIYPPEDVKLAESYAKFFKSSTSLFQSTVAQRAREEAAKTQLEEIRVRNEIESAKRQGKPIPDLQSLRNNGESKLDSKNTSDQTQYCDKKVK